MRGLDEYFSQYSSSHRHPQNIFIHKVCVPLILWSILGLSHFVILFEGVRLNMLLAIVLVGFYLWLRAYIYALILGLVCVAMIHSLYWVHSLMWVSLCVFVFAWVGQFLGHKIEGEKPAFFKDIFFLLIGPGWVIKSIVGK